MGLFHKQPPQKTDPDGSVDVAAEQHFLDENFREELRNHGRWYFEKVISENGELFKKDLDSTLAQINSELREHIESRLDDTISHINDTIQEHVARKLDEQLAQYTGAMQEAQQSALRGITESTQTLEAEHKRLAESLQKNVTEQEALLHTTFEDNKAQIAAMKDAQGAALQWLNQSAQALHEQHEQLATTLQKTILEHESMLIDAFEANMAQVVEHYLLGALGDQYDLKSQLPSIIKQMEANKQAMVDDMKL